MQPSVQLPTPGLLDRLVLNPIAVRELRVAGRSNRLLIVVTLLLVLQWGAQAVLVGVLMSTGTDRPESLGQFMFITQSIATLVTVVAIFPAFSCTAIAAERERNALDMLSLSHLPAWEVVWGKLVSAVMQSALFATLSLPFFVVAVALGGVPWSLLGAVLIALFLVSIGISSLGIYCSAVIKRPTGAVALTYMLSIMFGFMMLTAGGALIMEYFFRGGRENEGLNWLISGPVIQRLALVLGAAGFILFQSAFLIAAATSKLLTEGENRHTALRILALVVAVFMAAMWLLVSQALSGTGFAAAFIIGSILLFMTLMTTLFASVKQIADVGFAPRRTARELAADKSRFKWLKWVVSPGATPSLVCMMLVALMVVGTGALVMGSRVNAEAVQQVKERPEGGLGNVGDFMSERVFSQHYQTGIGPPNGVALLNRADDVLKRKMEQQLAAGNVYEARPEAIEAANSVGNIYLYGTVAFVLVLLAFGLLARMISFSPFGAKAPAMWSGLAIALVIIGPMILGPIMREYDGPDLSQLSPAMLLGLAVELARLDVVAELSPDHAGLVSDARWSALRIATPSLVLVGCILLVGLLGGIYFGKRAEAARQAAGGRWPVPRIPPPREFVASGQTALLAGPVDVAPPTEGPSQES